MNQHILKNKIFLVNFPTPLNVEEVNQYYNVFYADLPLTDYVLTRAHLIIIYHDQDIKNLDPHILYNAKNPSFYRDIYHYNKEQVLAFCKNPLAELDLLVGRQRQVNPRQFEMLEGSIVRSLVDLRLGAGIVKSIENDFLYVHFPKAKGYYQKEIVKCHKSHIRLVSHIQEVKQL